MASIKLSRRALRDIQGIESYSKEKWGNQVAGEYLKSIEEGLNLLRENTSLLRSRSGVSDSLCFYRIRQHYLVCALYEENIFVLTVKHGAMDLVERIAELEPHLTQEAEMLYRALRRGFTD